MRPTKLHCAAAVLGMLFTAASVSTAQTAASKPAIVLVHGAFADGSSWARVIPLLERDGYYVIAVQNPLSSLDDDIANTKRVIDAQKGPVVAVGHSYGGVVITGAAAGNPNVKALVYIAAFGPEANEPVGPLTEKYPSDLGKALRPDAAGYLYVDRGLLHQVFAADVPSAEARIIAATQKPVNNTVFAATLPSPAWKTIPSWYLVARNDRALNPDLQRFYARRMGATITEVASSHVPFFTHPKVVVRVIKNAATAPWK